MTHFPTLKIEDTRRENEQTRNSRPFAISLSNPDPVIRAFILKVLNNNEPISLDYNAVRKTGAIVEQNTKNILRIVLKDDANLFKSHLEIDYKRWIGVQERFGLLPGIIKKVEDEFKNTDNSKKYKITP